MIKKILLLTFSFFLMTQCGFTPMYSENSKYIEKIKINDIQFKGDDKVNKYLKIYLSKYNNKENENGFNIKVNTDYRKEIASKDKTAKTTNYKLSNISSFEVSLKGKIIKKIIIEEQNNIENLSDKFEEQKYENDIKQNFASSISNKLLLELTLLNDN